MLKALALADKAVFRNCLIAMKPKAVHSDVPSARDVGKHIHNEFVKWLNQLKSDIMVCVGLENSKYNTYLTIVGSTRKNLVNS